LKKEEGEGTGEKADAETRGRSDTERGEVVDGVESVGIFTPHLRPGLIKL
jgi:hypothetical protein